MTTRNVLRPLSAALAGIAAFIAAHGAAADDALLQQVTAFSAAILDAETDVPGMVIGAIRDGETVVLGFGRTSDANPDPPDGDTLIRVGSISKVFAGATLASLVVDGTVGFTDRLQDRLASGIAVPTLDGHAIRLIDLVTHASGLPREFVSLDPVSDLQAENSDELLAALEEQTLLFPPGTGILYSNFAFDVLAVALGDVAGKPYADLLRERILEPAGMADTTFNFGEGDAGRAFEGHQPDGSAVPVSVMSPMVEGSGSLISTPNDMLKWLDWHLDRFSDRDPELRFLDQATYLSRDGLAPISGLDEFIPMSAMGLGWVVLEPEGNRPYILQKTGAFQGTMSYVAFAPHRGVGAFVSLSKFDFDAFRKAIAAVNGLITELSPR